MGVWINEDSKWVNSLTVLIIKNNTDSRKQKGKKKPSLDNELRKPRRCVSSGRSCREVEKP